MGLRLLISIHAPRTGSDLAISSFGGANLISIHAPRTGSDSITVTIAVEIHISIHAPRTGSDLQAAGRTRRFRNFNPRSPHGERPTSKSNTPQTCVHFNPRSPHGERPAATANTAARSRFQSTLPARGATWCSSKLCTAEKNFNPRSPHGERPSGWATTRRERSISIHAPRTGSDHRRFLPGAGLRISIHAPRTGSDQRVNAKDF